MPPSPTSRGQIVLLNATVVVLSSLNEAAPPAVLATATEVGDGGSRSAALEGVLVEVRNVTVTDPAPSPGAGDSVPTNEFRVESTLLINDLFYLTSPMPVLDDVYASITGILEYKHGAFKVEPRDSSDLTPGPGALVGLGPAMGFVGVGQHGVSTTPSPLTVFLSGPVDHDIFVAFTSSDPAQLSVVGGGVTLATDQTSAPVIVDGLAQESGDPHCNIGQQGPHRGGPGGGSFGTAGGEPLHRQHQSPHRRDSDLHRDARHSSAGRRDDGGSGGEPSRRRERARHRHRPGR